MEPELVQKIAHLARLRLSSDERERFAGQLTKILGYFEKLQSLSTESTAPAIHPDELKGPTRPDLVTEFDRASTLPRMAKQREDGCYQVPRILDGGES